MSLELLLLREGNGVPGTLINYRSNVPLRQPWSKYEIPPRFVTIRIEDADASDFPGTWFVRSGNASRFLFLFDHMPARVRSKLSRKGKRRLTREEIQACAYDQGALFAR